MFKAGEGILKKKRSGSGTQEYVGRNNQMRAHEYLEKIEQTMRGRNLDKCILSKHQGGLKRDGKNIKGKGAL